MFHNSAYEILPEFAESTVAVAGKQILSVFQDPEVNVLTTACRIGDRLRHEARLDSLAYRDVPDDVLAQENAVRRSKGIGESKLDLLLTGRTDLDADDWFEIVSTTCSNQPHTEVTRSSPATPWPEPAVPARRAAGGGFGAGSTDGQTAHRGDANRGPPDSPVPLVRDSHLARN